MQELKSSLKNLPRFKKGDKVWSKYRGLHDKVGADGEIEGPLEMINKKSIRRMRRNDWGAAEIREVTRRIAESQKYVIPPWLQSPAHPLTRASAHPLTRSRTRPLVVRWTATLNRTPYSISPYTRWWEGSTRCA